MDRLTFKIHAGVGNIVILDNLQNKYIITKYFTTNKNKE